MVTTLWAVPSRDQERIRAKDKQVEQVEQIVYSADLRNELLSTKFNVIATSIFTKTEEEPPRFIPAEISALKFSVSGGVEVEKFQSFPVPGSIPLGFKGRFKMTSETTHKVPLQGVSEPPTECYTEKEVLFVNEDAEEVLSRLYHFLNTPSSSSPLVVFTIPSLIDQVRGVLSCLVDRASPH